MPAVYRIGRSDNLVADDCRVQRTSTPTSARSCDWHFSPETGTPVLARLRADGSTGIRARRSRPTHDLDRFGFFQDEWLRGGPVRRWVPKALRGRADLHLRDRRLDRRAEVAHQHRRLPHRLRDLQRHAARRVLPEGQRLADGRAVRPAPAAPGGRAPRAAPRRHLASASISIRAGSSSCIKARQMDQVEAYKRHVHRSGADAAQGARQHPVHVHHAEAARSAGGEDLARRRPASPASSAAAPR